MKPKSNAPQANAPHTFPIPPTANLQAHATAVAPMVAHVAQHAPAVAKAVARKPLPMAAPMTPDSCK